MSLAFWNGMWGQGFQLPWITAQTNGRKGREVQDRNTTDASQLGVLFSTGTAKGTGKMEPRARGRQDGIKNINSSVTYCVWGLKISVCSWQWFYGGFFCCCYGLFFKCIHHITTNWQLKSTVMPEQQPCRSPSVPSACLGTLTLPSWQLWRPWATLSLSCAYITPGNADRHSYPGDSSSLPPPASFFFFLVHSRCPFMGNRNPMLIVSQHTTGDVWCFCLLLPALFSHKTFRKWHPRSSWCNLPRKASADMEE